MDFFLFGQADRSRLKTTSNNLKKTELSIKDKITSIETECRDIARKLNTQNKYVAASMSAKNLQRKKLNLEEEKFNQGRSSIQWVLRYQDDLAAALSNYYRALTDYYNLKADLELYTGAYK